ncbi:MAG: HAD hydrolase family protein, partial [Oscillospiraceae bacterium]|nr:HAD hydrolase family protein [Oscillospiraceae bacterium]
MKTLYISDLDGTLLNSDAEISSFTANALNSLIEKGLLFSYATA